MKRYLVLSLIAFGIISCTDITPITTDKNITTKKILTIDLDKELKKSDYSKGNLKGVSKVKIIPIYIKDKDELIIKGTILRKSSSIRVGDNDEVSCNKQHKINILRKINPIEIGENDEVSCKGDEYRIKTSELKADELITIKYNEKEKIELRIRTQ